VKKSSSKYHHGDLKQALLKAAKRLVVEKGKDALSLRGIATEVGVSHMAPYAHFKNKSELFKAVAASCFLQLGNKLEKILQQDNNPDELVLLYGVAYVEFAIENPEMYELMLSQTHPNKSKLIVKFPDPHSVSEYESSLQETSKRTYLLLRDCFARKESNQSIVNMQAQGAWALVHGVSSLLISGQIVLDSETSIKQFLDTASQGLSD